MRCANFCTFGIQLKNHEPYFSEAFDFRLLQGDLLFHFSYSFEEDKQKITMAVYYKFKSARDYDSVQLDGAFISVGALKEKIFESKHLGRGTDFDLVVTNAQTNEGWFLFPKMNN